jgi:hypothetical protein
VESGCQLRQAGLKSCGWIGARCHAFGLASRRSLDSPVHGNGFSINCDHQKRVCPEYNLQMLGAIV